MIGLLFLIIGFVAMELASWAIHKYLMHGPLWFIHKTHHNPSKGKFELNDVFTLFFGSIAIILIVLGLPEWDYRFWLGAGISLYGMVYFIFHDMFIHRRVKWAKRPGSKIIEGIANAHKDHHKTNKRDGAICFGLLYVPKRYFKFDK